jgi:hypothetical protein
VSDLSEISEDEGEVFGHEEPKLVYFAKSSGFAVQLLPWHESVEDAGEDGLDVSVSWLM